MTLSQHILMACPGVTRDDIDGHETDLYVRHSPAVLDFLRTCYPDFAKSMRPFRCEREGDIWLDIPFGRMESRYPKPTA